MLRASSSLRPALRSRAPARSTRFASTSGPSNPNPQLEAAQKKAQEAFASTQETASKAFESAKKYAGPLGESASKYLASASKAAGPVGEKAGNMLGAYKQPIMYNLAVARELAKHVYRAEGLAPPTSLDTVRNAYRTMFKNATSREFWVKTISSGDIARLGIYAIEAYGIFKIGEILGRRSLVGYNLK